MSRDHDLSTIAREQHGLLSLDDLRRVGVPAADVTRRCHDGRLTRLHPGVYLMGGAPITWHARQLAACLTTGGVASHRAAAALWRIGGLHPGRPEVTVPRTRRVRLVDTDVRVHQSLAFDLVDATVIDGIPVTGLTRSLVDLARFTGPARLGHAVDEARRHGATWPELWECLVLHARRGRPGIVRLRTVFRERYGDRDPESLLERIFLRLVADAGLPRPDVQVVVHDTHGFVARVDVAYPDARIAIELDSRRWHLDAAAFEADRRKRNRLKLAGWQVLEFTWQMVTEEPRLVVAQVREALRVAGVAA